MSPPNRRRLVSAAVISLATAAFLYVVAVHTKLGQRLDDNAINPHAYERVSDLLANFVVKAIASTLAAVAALGALATQRRRKGDASAPLALQVTMVLTAIAAVELLRLEPFSTRPSLVYDTLQGPSFPSGHSAFAMAVGVLLLVSDLHVPWVSARLRWVVPATIISGANTLILTLPIHRPSDVIGSSLIVFSVSLLLIAALPDRLVIRAIPRSDNPETIASTGVNVLAVATTLTGVSFAMVAIIMTPSRFAFADLGPTYPFAIALCTFTTTGLVRLFAHLLEERLIVARRRVRTDDSVGVS